MGLGGRIAVVLLLPVGLCFAGFAVSTVSLRRQLMMHEAEQEVRDIGILLRPAIDAFTRDHPPGDLSDLTAELSGASRIRGVVLFDAHDHVIAGASAETPDAQELAALATEARRSGKPRERLLRFDGDEVYAYAIPSSAQPSSDQRGAAVLLRDLRYIRANLETFEREIAAITLLVMCVIALGTWAAMRRLVARPLASLLTGVENVARGDLQVAIPVARGDEIGRLATSFNQMTGSLRRARAELDAKQQANLALERRAQHAQRLALVGQLTATVAHQIGSPLNVILGRARYALRTGGQGERDRRHFQEIAVGAESISRVIEQLLTQARRARGPVETIDLANVAEHTLAFLEAECERLSIRTSLSASGDCWVQGRRDEFEQLLLNLCLNAIQAQPGGGTLAISVAQPAAEGKTAAVVVEVADSGPGVPAPVRSQIFEPFFTTKTGSEGTGLGLAICEEIVRAMGGTIQVEDASSGGALFRIHLPAQVARWHQPSVLSAVPS